MATNNAKEATAQSVEPVTISLKRSQKIVDEGDIITTSVMSQIAAVRNYSTSTRQVNRFFGLLILLTALYWAAWKFIEHRGMFQ